MDTPTQEESKIIKHWHIYALKLEQDKYYIGSTTKINPYDRIKQHGVFNSAKWTKKYKPVETLEIIDLGITTKKEADKLEKTLTLKYMDKYGAENVRGGDLAYSGKYYRRFGRFFMDNDWETLTVIIFLLLIILILVLIRK